MGPLFLFFLLSIFSFLPLSFLFFFFFFFFFLRCSKSDFLWPQLLHDFQTKLLCKKSFFWAVSGGTPLGPLIPFFFLFFFFFSLFPLFLFSFFFFLLSFSFFFFFLFSFFSFFFFPFSFFFFLFSFFFFLFRHANATTVQRPAKRHAKETTSEQWQRNGTHTQRHASTTTRQRKNKSTNDMPSQWRFDIAEGNTSFLCIFFAHGCFLAFVFA